MDAATHSSSSVGAYAGWLLIFGLTAVAAILAFDPASAQEDQTIDDPVAFATASYANVCAQCHGGDGAGGIVPGTDRPAPSLTDRDQVNASYLDLVLRTGRMPPAGDPFDNRDRKVFYDDAERQAMVNYMVEEFGLVSDIPTVEEGDVALGLEAFALNCAHCHGNAGSGGTAGENAWTPRVNNVAPVAVAEAIRVGPFQMPAYGFDVLNEEEVNSIASYLQAVEEESGTPVFGLTELNPVFASGFVALLAALMVGSLLYIGGRPIALEASSDPPEIPNSIEKPTGMTPDPEDPELPQQDRARQQDHEPVPYLDQDKGSPTEGSKEKQQADEADEAGLDERPDEGPEEEGTQ